MSTNKDDWIEWTGAETGPVDDDNHPKMDLRFRNGKVQRTSSGGWRWTDTGNAWDIVAYRVVQS